MSETCSQGSSRVAIIVPVLDEGSTVVARLSGLRELGADELIVVDGGSRDDTAALARPWCDRLLESDRGRARQMNAGAAVAASDVLWFVHADTIAPATALAELRQALGETGEWGRFDVRLDGRRRVFRVIAFAMNWRSRLTGIATGDQGIFVRRALFEKVGGFPDQPLMEDVALSRLLHAAGPMAVPRVPITTSSRRWERNGVWRTIVLMWGLRLAYALGVSPARLHRLYYGRDDHTR